jgi:hypothetical protein
VAVSNNFRLPEYDDVGGRKKISYEEAEGFGLRKRNKNAINQPR